ncbi:MAG: penicillin-binding protein activator LpoB [Treponema sp.]|nr:penicillin-binding protein activator LpoB [Treponema sp.]
MKKIAAIICLFAMAVTSVMAAGKVKRLSEDEVVDLNGYWNENDVKVVCEALINDCIQSPRVAKFEEKNGRAPVVVLGTIKNESVERIDTKIISKRMQNAIIKTGVLEFVADKSERDELREEVAQQADHSSEETAKAIDEEEGADFMLMGSVKTIVQQNAKESIRTYYVTVQLMDLQSHRIIWSGDNEDAPVRKYFKQKKVKL